MNRLLLAYYGDDFTGSTDVLEALSLSGVRTVLFLREPDPEDLERFPGCRAAGLAGVSRSQSPAWMRVHLPGIFSRLAQLGAPLLQYKVCSTFDSSPEVGNIGCAIEIGQQVIGCSWSPVVVAVPRLGRYLLFGNLFARAGETIYRIDRHPAMSRHPVTPMWEADLRLHLGKQTRLRIGLVDILALLEGRGQSELNRRLAEGCRIVFLDGLDERTDAEVGALLWSHCQAAPLFAVGSSGLNYALGAAWQRTGELLEEHEFPSTGPVHQLLVISGSCAPQTAEQIRWALDHGFAGFRLDPHQPDAGLALPVLDVLREGRSAVVYTALGPDDRVPGPSPRIGPVLGELVRYVLERHPLRRIVVAGGDTAGQVGQQLDIEALTFLCPLEPGAPLCRAHSANSIFDGLEVVFKGGQIGSPAFFEVARRGG